MANIITKFLTLGEGKKLKKYRQAVDFINGLEPKMEAMDDQELKQFAGSLQSRAQSGESLDDLMPDTFAMVREASRRTIGLRHFDVQLIGAMALHDGCIGEMKTGEGKTLVSTAAGVLNSLDGSNVHVVTVNDYLAQRDAEWMGQIYDFLGMKAGVIWNMMPPEDRVEAYSAHVTYGTNSEFGFDYLRDNMVSDAAGRVQRGHRFAIIDEVDSILIDEARTPLIISGMGNTPTDEYRRFAAIMTQLEEDKDFVMDEKKRTIYATEHGLDHVEELLGQEVYADVSGKLANHLKQALKAQFLFHKDIDYVVADDEVKIVDEFTGRILEGRRWSDGLHQAVEAKEGVEIQDETQTLATITLQNYFRLYEKISGMTGTAITEDSEFRQIYHLPVIPIPTNKPMIREDRPDFIYRTLEAKFKAVADEVERRHEKGQPILVGTASIEASERLSRLLQKRGVKHEVLNAKNPEREAQIVAQAGRVGAVTIATNMAGRGTDILLGGNPTALEDEWLEMIHAVRDYALDWQMESAKTYAEATMNQEGYVVRQLGGLFVLGTERHESRRIDNQLRGRAGRQGDPGESRFYLSLEDNLLRKFGGDRLNAVSDMMVKQGISDDTPLEDALVSKVIDTAQHQVESIHFASRKSVLEYDDVMNLQRKAIYEERNAILDGKDMETLLPEIIDTTVQIAIDEYCPNNLPADDWDVDGLAAWLSDLVGQQDYDVTQEIDEDTDPFDLMDTLTDYLQDVVAEKREFFGEDQFNTMVKMIMLQVMDTSWVEHLQEMNYLKEGIGLRGIGQRDPLVEYKDEAYKAFDELINSIYHDLLAIILHLSTEVADEASLEEELGESPFDPEKMIYNNVDAALTTSSDFNISDRNPLAN